MLPHPRTPQGCAVRTGTPEAVARHGRLRAVRWRAMAASRASALTPYQRHPGWALADSWSCSGRHITLPEPTWAGGRRPARSSQVEALVVGAAEQVDHHRRDRRPVRDAVARDQPPGQLAVPVRHQHDGRGRMHRAQHTAHQAGDVEHRHNAQAHQLGPAAAPLAGHGVVHQRSLCVHAALDAPSAGHGSHVVDPTGLTRT